MVQYLPVLVNTNSSSSGQCFELLQILVMLVSVSVNFQTPVSFFPLENTYWSKSLLSQLF